MLLELKSVPDGERTPARPFDEPAEAPTAPRRRARRTPADRLRAALLALSSGHGEVQHHNTRGWSSITFSGTRHTIRMAFDGAEAVAAGEHLVAELSEHEFTIPGQLVADAEITGVENTLLPEPRMLVECEILMLEDA
ncbi:hypothetical protein HME9302_00755 [Alteripontixanthobacter maritimus]|uniref:Uncharacterized protein n=1 Tax=Alteripontixanthobacter maritimus TaxID=2161824 RepID=A0A369Q7R4_9SPHN|nr:hypothetical protein [Alteripontixanthobacter maritimus]RDC59565.1 hypothetical protein HME9302_00755 [Alteripontixanthobacter maritimus]